MSKPPLARSSVTAWFQAKYGEPTPAQERAWPPIRRGENVLLASPTGTGKTFAAFLAVLDALVTEHASGDLKNGIQCLYVSPLRALSYDLEKNLAEPLEELFSDVKESPIRVALRTGDTTASERARQLKTPPHILLTTPESLCVLLSQEQWLPRLASIRWLIVDEIHALAESKRGAHLSISIERLEQLVSSFRSQVGSRPPPRPCGLPVAGCVAPLRSSSAASDNVIRQASGRRHPGLQRIGLSATIAPLEEVGRFLAGTQGHCHTLDISAAKKLVLKVYTPLSRNPYPEAGYTGERLIRELAVLIQKHQTTLVFCNVRSSAEAVTYWLRQNLSEIADQIECHHASLDRDVRREVEDRLKRGELRAVVCSSSLELGIDIGSVELVVMLATPKGVSKALQRAGRAGHNIHAISRGVLMATNVSDLVESAATALLARKRYLEHVRMPQAPLDVLAQQLVSMGCTQRWPREEAFNLVRGAYPFHALTSQEFDDVLEYLAGGGEALRNQYSEVFGKILLEGKTFVTRGGRVRRELLQNIGVIPSVGVVRVRSRFKTFGAVEESFIQQLRIGDVFMIAGRAVRLERLTQMEAWVTLAPGEVPTVPRWNASKIALSNRVCQEIIAFRGELRANLSTELLSTGQEHHLIRWIAARLDCAKSNATIIWKMHRAQHAVSEIPTADFLLVEEYLPAADEKAASTRRQRPPASSVARHYFFHSVIGRAANDALARVVTYRLSKLRGGNAIATPHDYGFVLTVASEQHFEESDLPMLLQPDRFEADLHAALERSSMLKYHFRNAAQTGLMVYRNYFDQQKPVRKLAWSAEVLFNVLQQHEPEHVLMREARRDTLRVFVDAEGALAFAQTQANRPVKLRKVDRVPPLSFAMYATKIKEALLVEDPYETMERLYHQWWRAIEDGSGPA